MAVVVACVLIPRAPFATDKIYGPDEAIFAMAANTVVDGGVLYKDATDIKTPGIYLILAAVFKIFGKWDLAPQHWMLSIVVALTAVGIYLLGSVASSRQAGVLSALLFALASFNSYPFDVFSFQTEWLMILFCSWAMWLFLAALGSGKVLPMALSGVVFALASLSKQPAALHYGCCWVFLAAAASLGNRRARFAQLVAFSLSFAGLLVLTIAYFFARGALADMVYYCWDYNRMYSSVIPFREKIWRTYTNLALPGSLLRENHLMTYPAILSVLLAGPRSFMGSRPARPEAILLILVWTLSSLAAIFISGTGYIYYFIQVLPPLCIASGLFFDAAVGWLERARPMAGKGRDGWFAVLFVAILFYYPTLYSTITPSKVSYRVDTLPWFAVPDRISNFTDLGSRVDYNQASQYLKNNTREEETVFVWGFLPHVYLRSERRPASRYLVSNFLTGVVLPGRVRPEGVAPDAWNKLIGDLERNRPAYILDSSVTDHFAYKDVKPTNYPQLKRYMEENFVLDRVIDMVNSPSFHLYRRKDLLPQASTGAPGAGGYWPMDWNVYDRSGRGLHGFSVGVIYEAGHQGAAAYFDGINDHISIPDVLLGSDHGFTVAFWAKPDKVQRHARFIDWGNGPASDNVFLSRRGTTNDLTFQVYRGQEAVGVLTAAEAIETGRWQHFAVTVDEQGNSVLYKDGQPLASGQTALPTGVARKSNLIGQSNWPADRNYSGLLDEMRFVPRALSAEEIRALLEAPDIKEAAGTVLR